jgi:phosphoribosyl 1,2-cyclic phosphate phosphodiesterase
MYCTRNDPEAKLLVYGNEKVLDVIRGAYLFDSGGVPDSVELHEITPFRSIDTGGVTLTPLTADHDNREACVFYLIERGGRRFLFANDTTDFPPETYKFLEGKRLDTVSLDCTSGKYRCGRSHMGFPDNLAVKDKLIVQGAADKDTLFISHHFSHNGHVNYDDFAALAGESGFVSSWDGMEVIL